MPYFKTSEEWLTQSSLLIKARPSTTRVVTKYTTQNPTEVSAQSRKRKRVAEKGPVEAADNSTVAVAEANPTGELTLKTFDPVSGACLKYKTDKAAEVGRLIAALGRLSKNMAALPDQGLGEEISNVVEEAASQAQQVAKDVGDSVASAAATVSGIVADATGTGAGGKKKKKKGKK